jgi:hypothetical protein
VENITVINNIEPAELDIASKDAGSYKSDNAAIERA